VQDVTRLMNEYRECARGLWNRFLLAKMESATDFEAVGRFQRLSALLFDDLVLRPLGMPFWRPKQFAPYPFLRLQPTSDPVALMINRPTVQGMYWDEPIDRLALSGLSLLFIDYFDWNDFDQIDLQYFRLLIDGCQQHPRLAGRQALMDVHQARVMFDPQATPLA
jgi:hypothetical protein